MNSRDILFSIAIILVIAALYQTSFLCNDDTDTKRERERYRERNRTETFNKTPGSAIDAQKAAAQRAENQRLYRMCSQMFGEDNKFVTTCQASDDGILIHEPGIRQAYEMYLQNKRDGIEWGSNIYLQIVTGDAERIICQTVYRNDPVMQWLCFRSTANKRKEMWIDYWKERRQNSADWRLQPNFLQI